MTNTTATELLTALSRATNAAWKGSPNDPDCRARIFVAALSGAVDALGQADASNKLFDLLARKGAEMSFWPLYRYYRFIGMPFLRSVRLARRLRMR